MRRSTKPAPATAGNRSVPEAALPAIKGGGTPRAGLNVWPGEQEQHNETIVRDRKRRAR
jgi:hypothetical protein